MVPAAVVDDNIADLSPHLEAGDILIDGGNSYYVDDLRRAKQLSSQEIHHVDVGTSGGVWVWSEVTCMMIGGEAEVVQRLDPIFAALAPGSGDISAHRWPGEDQRYGRAGLLALRPKRRRSFRQDGAQRNRVWGHGGIRGGISILRKANAGKQASEAADAETAPLRDPEHYQYDMNLRDIAEVWRRGSVIASWLLDLTAAALLQDPNLSRFAGHVSDSGEGRWTIKAAIDEAVPAQFSRRRFMSDSVLGARRTLPTSSYPR